MIRDVLSGLKVIDLTQARVGPFCAAILADHGADVIKVEPLRGDLLRWAPPFADTDIARHHRSVFAAANRNKRSLCLDLKVPAARDVLLRLVGCADVLVENYSAGMMARLGLGYGVLSARNPRLVYASMRGLMAAVRPAADTPARVGSWIGDTVPGLYAAFGIMAALRVAASTGEGQYVDVAETDSALAAAEVVVNTYACTGESLVPLGNQLRGSAPFETVKCKNGVVALGAPYNPQWARLTELMGRPELAADKRFNSDQNRWDNRDAVHEIVNEWTAQYTVAELLSILDGKIPVGPVYNAGPHCAARDMPPSVAQPGTSGAVRHRAPLLGEHSAEILAAAGYTDVEIEALAPARELVAE